MKSLPHLNPITADLFPALIAVGLQLAAGTVAGLPVPPVVLAVTALGGYCVYTADHASGTSRSGGFRWSSAYTRVALATMLLLAIATIFPGVRHLTLGIYILMSVLYVIPLSSSLPRLQDLPLIRSLAIPVCWALIPLLNRQVRGSREEWIWMAGMGCMLAAAHLLSDWKDATSDREHQRPTLPSTCTHEQIRWMCWGLLTLSALLFCLTPSTRMMTPGPLIFFCHTTLKGLWQTARIGDVFLLWGWVAWLITRLGNGL